MSAPAPAPSPAPAAAERDTRAAVFVALLCGGWIAGALWARQVGIWIGISSAALLLGTGVLCSRRGASVRAQLRPSRRHIAVGTIAGLVMVGATWVLFPIALRLVPQVLPETAALYGAFGQATPWKLALMSLVILGEEVVWRGAVQGTLGRRTGRFAVVLAALAYGAAHLPVGSLLLAVVALCCGLYWGLLAALTRSLVPPLLAHLIWDMVVLVWAPLLSRR